MLVDNSVYKNSYTGTGTTTEFPITFPFLENKHIQVIQSTDNGITESEVPSSDYTISGAGLEAGGTCTFKVAPQAGVLIIIRRNVPITQLYAYKELDNFPAESHENALAKLTMIDQQQQEQINRALKVSGASQQSPEELMDELFQIRDDSEAAKSAAEAAKSAAEAAQSAAEDCRDTACECASQAQNTLDSAVQVIQNQESISKNAVIAQEQASVSVVQSEGDEQAKRLEDIATTILISAASYNKTVSVKLTSAITNGETYTLPESLVYLVGRSQLFVSGNGVWFYKGFQYEEVGTDGVASTQIKFLQDLAIDDVLTFTILANRVNVLTATNSGLVNDADGHLKLNVDGQTVLINASGQVYVPVMVGATASTAGTTGLAPAADAGQQDKPLTGGGKYADSLDCDITGHAEKDLSLDGGTIKGTVTFKDNSYDISQVPNVSYFSGAIILRDKNNKSVYQLQHIHYHNGQTGVRILVYDKNGNEYAPLVATYNPELGLAYILGYTPQDNDNSEKFATTAWINKYAAKKPQSSSGKGQVVRIEVSGTNACKAPSGGSWMCYVTCYPDIWNSTAGVFAGGATIANAGTGSDYYRRGFAWRIA